MTLKVDTGAKPGAWLHCSHPEAYVITDRVKEIWLACNPRHVEHYTIPLFPIVLDDAKPKG